MADPAHICDHVWVAKVVSHHRPRERRGAATRPARGSAPRLSGPGPYQDGGSSWKTGKVYQKGRNPTVQNCTSYGKVFGCNLSSAQTETWGGSLTKGRAALQEPSPCTNAPSPDFLFFLEFFIQAPRRRLAPVTSNCRLNCTTSQLIANGWPPRAVRGRRNN
jgi:hypothetical protein